jgi:hypothetical protein
MDDKLQQELYDKYPDLFIEKNLGMKETCMCWGIDCDSGWASLIDYICSYIAMNLKYNWHCYPRFRFRQVKEKFGTLRLYYVTERMSLEEYFKKCLDSDRNEYLKKSVDSSEFAIEYEKYVEQCKRGAECFDGAVNFAEHMSSHICEICGTNQDADIRHRGNWLKTLCFDCMDIQGYDVTEDEKKK